MMFVDTDGDDHLSEKGMFESQIKCSVFYHPHMRQGTRNLSVEPVRVCAASGQLHSVKFVMFNFSRIKVT